MGITLYQPNDMTWEEWMCELMCGTPEDEMSPDGGQKDVARRGTTTPSRRSSNDFRTTDFDE